MIRINLLPQKKRAEQREGSQLWLVALLVLLLAELIGFVLFHGYKRDQLEAQKHNNNVIEAQIEKARNAVKNQAQVKAKLQRLRDREDAISKLQSARTGPTAMMLEMARILTPGRGPSVSPEKLAQLRRNNPLAVYNPNWDARRLWLTKFVEEHRQVRLEGVARDGEDVSELARRMNLSSYFYDVKLLPAHQIHDQGTDLDLVQFQLEAKVRY